MADSAAVTVELVVENGFIKAKVGTDTKDLFIWIREGPTPADQDWPEFLRGWVLQWVPLEGQPFSNDGRIDQTKLGAQDRSAFHSSRTYVQAMYGSCPLFTFEGSGADPGIGEATGLWERVTLDSEKPGRPVGAGP